MAMIEWSDAFRTGIASVDYEHAELIALLNQLCTTIDAKDTAAVQRLLGDLHDAIAAHFALEEAVMQSSRYAGYQTHKADHERLLDEIRAIMEEQHANRISDPIDALRPRLEAWFMRHFSTEDVRLHRATKA